jgi:hypothetical protein
MPDRAENFATQTATQLFGTRWQARLGYPELLPQIPGDVRDPQRNCQLYREPIDRIIGANNKFVMREADQEALQEMDDSEDADEGQDEAFPVSLHGPTLA